MLEKYDRNYDEKEFVRAYMEKKNIDTISKALAQLRKEIPLEKYFQTEIRKTLRKKYPDALIRKIAQGAYSEAGIPDLMMIYRGHYFGWEIKRPVFGEPSKLQRRTIAEIERAGGTAAFVTWPEECIHIIERWEEEERCYNR